MDRVGPRGGLGVLKKRKKKPLAHAWNGKKIALLSIP
jgi:hypothetical protein